MPDDVNNETTEGQTAEAAGPVADGAPSSSQAAGEDTPSAPPADEAGQASQAGHSRRRLRETQKLECRRIGRHMWRDTSPRLSIQLMPATVSEQYRALVLEGEIERDAAQEALAARLTRLEERLAQHRLSRKSSHLGWLFAKRRG